jgi:hypothetical protein
MFRKTSFFRQSVAFEWSATSTSRAIKWCALGLFLPLLLPLFTGQMFVRGDLGNFHIPIRYLYHEALRTGDSFWWTPALYSGFFLFGEGQAGMAHPFHWLIYRALPLSVALNLEIVSGYLITLTGMRLCLRRFGLSADCAWFGGMVFAFSGFNLLHLYHVNAIGIVSHAPWLLLATHVLMTSPVHRERAWAFGGVALLLASQLLLGYPQYVWLTWLGVAYLVICLLLAQPIRPSRLILLATAAALGVLVGSVQLLATRESLLASSRAAMSLELRMSYSLEPKNLLSLWSPDLSSVMSIYNGAFSTTALAWLAVRGRALPHRALIAALLVLAFIALLFALGPNGGVYPWLSSLPGLNTFRAPVRHTVLFHLSLSGIAAVVLEDLIGLTRRGETIKMRSLWPLAVPVVFGIATALAPLRSWWFGGTSEWWRGVLDPHWLRGNLMFPWPWLCVLTLAVVLVVLATRGMAWCVPALVFVAALDQGLWGYSYQYGLDGEYLRSTGDLSTGGPPDAVPGDLVFAPRLRDSATSPWMSSNSGVMRGLRRSSGYVGLPPKLNLDPVDPIAQRIAGVAWRPTETGWVRLTDSMPRVRLVARTQISADVAADSHLVDIARVALVGRPIASLWGEPGSTRIVTDRPGAIIVDTTASGRQLLVVTERFQAGWTANEDGRPRELVRVFGDYIGCVVEAGTHRVALTFVPASLRIGRLACGVGVSLTLLTMVFLLFPRTTPGHIRRADRRSAGRSRSVQ